MMMVVVGGKERHSLVFCIYLRVGRHYRRGIGEATSSFYIVYPSYIFQIIPDAWRRKCDSRKQKGRFFKGVREAHEQLAVHTTQDSFPNIHSISNPYTIFKTMNN